MSLREWIMLLRELYRKYKESQKPKPPEPVPEPEPSPTEIVVFDLTTVHAEIFARMGMPQVRWGVYNYGLSCELYGIAWSLMDAEIAAAYQVRDRIKEYGDFKINKAITALRADPALKAVAVVNDQFNGFGFRIAPMVMEALAEFGGRVRMGDIFPESGY